MDYLAAREAGDQNTVGGPGQAAHQAVAGVGLQQTAVGKRPDVEPALGAPRGQQQPRGAEAEAGQGGDVTHQHLDGQLQAPSMSRAPRLARLLPLQARWGREVSEVAVVVVRPMEKRKSHRTLPSSPLFPSCAASMMDKRMDG